MNIVEFHTLSEQQREMMIEIALGNNGKCTHIFGGMCGEIYILDQGKYVNPRYACAKTPNPLKNHSK